MKTPVLLFCCLALTAMKTFAQSISGPTAPCPLINVEYSLTLQRSCIEVVPSIEGAGNITSALQGQYSSDGTQVTWKVGVTWQNSYATDGTGKQAPFKVIFSHKCGDSRQSTTLNVYPKALPDIIWQSYLTSIACNFRGDAYYSIKPVTNASGYTWTNTGGWPGSSTSAGVTYNVNNSNPATITVIANGTCSGVKRTASIGVARPAPVDVPVFAASTPSDICTSSSSTATVTVGGMAPKGYEWYSTPANALNINGGQYNSTGSVLLTTTPSVTLTPGTASATARLYVRAVYNDCPPSPFAQQRINVGTPSSDRFLVYGSRFDYSATGPGNSYTVCPNEILSIYPQNNFEFNVLEHQWQRVYGSDNGASIPTQYMLSMNAPSGIRDIVGYQYRYRTACGWSGWNPLTITTMDCDNGEDPERKAYNKETVRSKPVSVNAFDFKISPNPATNLLNVELNTSVVSQVLKYKIIDISGKVVFEQQQAPQTRFQVNTGKIQPGNYIISIQHGTATASKMFIIIAR